MVQKRHPVQHPDYHYTAVAKNPYSLKLKEFSNTAYADDATEAFRGQWRDQFKSPLDSKRPLHVEIGCNGGHVILEWAKRDSSAAYIGLDWKFKQIYRGAEKAQKRGIANLIFLRGYAERVSFIFGAGEIDHLYLFFPDPWAKKSQLKNRYITAESLRMLSTLVKIGGIFHIKTDHAGYFEWIEAAIAEVPELWTIKSRTTDLHAGNLNPNQLQIPEVTLFEKIFIREGIKICSVHLERR